MRGEEASARRMAFEVLLQVEGGAKSGDALGRRLLGSSLDRRERALVGQMVYGSLRSQETLDDALGHRVRGGMAVQSPALRVLLRLGAYQIRFLRIPAHAAIHETVALTKAVGEGRAAGFVNAVLRRLAEQWPDPPADREGRLAVETSHPRWLVQSLLRWYGAAGEQILWADTRMSPLTLRVNRLRTDRDQLARKLGEAGVTTVPGLYVPEVLRVEGATGPVEELPGYREGEFSVQDEGAMLIGALLEPVAGGRYLDACAGLGGKALYLQERAAGGAQVVAMDTGGNKLDMLQEAATRLGLAVETRVRDVRHLEATAEGTFDGVLVDAPCSGLGVMGRRPEIRYRVSPGSLSSHHRLQVEILEGAARVVRPGGILLYATCSLAPVENREVVEAFLRRHGDFAPDPFTHLLPPALAREANPPWMLQLLPGRDGVDGFYMARMRRQAAALGDLGEGGRQ